MRTPARIQPIIDLLVGSGNFQAEWFLSRHRRPDLRLSQLLINEWIVQEWWNYLYHDECWVTMEKLWFLWREFAIRWWYGKNWDKPLQYKIIKDLDDDHINNIVEHIEWEMEKYNSLWVVEKFLKWRPRYSENQINKFKWEKMLRDIASLPDKTLIRLNWRWPCFTTKTPWEFRDYTSNDLLKPRNPDSYEIITKEEADKEIEEAMDSIHWH